MEALDEELVCAVCQDIFVDPVTLPCGHNFCSGCVAQLKRSASASDGGSASSSRAVPSYACPLCLASCDMSLELRRNVALHNITERLWQRGEASASTPSCDLCKGLKRASAAKTCVSCGESFCALHLLPHQENPAFRHHVLVRPTCHSSRLCKQHGKELELYCQTDKCPLCAYCMLPGEASHLDHQVLKLTDAASIFKNDCKYKLSKVDQNLAAVENGLCQLEEAASAQKEKLEKRQQTHLNFFRKVQLFLDIEDQAWKKRFSVATAQLNLMVDCEKSKLKQLRAKLQQAKGTLQIGICVNNPVQLLQILDSVKSTEIQEQDLGLKDLRDVTNNLQNIEACFTKSINSRRILTSLGELFSSQAIQLDANSAHLQLKISRKGTAVEAVEAKQSNWCNAERFSTSLNVLATTGYITGLHYWEVNVKDIPSWAVGIAYQSIPRMLPGSKLGTEENSWAFSCSERGLYCAQHDTEVMYFHYENQLENVGVYLDCDSGILAFCDAESVRCLYTFYCTLKEPVFPAFCPKFDDSEEFSVVPLVVHSGIID
ncbi:E3 ubiquitin-protein ligase Midline-1-like [Rhincodon typus]|uniref:E3 ubiquitin-protein ligase Midline-1-like n=1 Tax=Rhincodon typus TaxID=259920 RepID=UPI00203030AE|nr:E3 ubiquitin-protein ligase Midline-1-like [Rhincodon typus]